MNKLREKYGRMSDEELKELLLAGKGEFEPEAFNLLVEEARKRQMEIETGISAAEQSVSPAKALERELEIEQESYAILAVLNDDADVEFAKNKLSPAGIKFNLEPLSFVGKTLPVGLDVAVRQASEAIELLKDFQPKSSIVLW